MQEPAAGTRALLSLLILFAAGCGERPGSPATEPAPNADSLEFTQPVFRPAPEVDFTDNFARSRGDVDPWTVVSGNWCINSFRDPNLSSNPFKYVGYSNSPEVSVSCTGDDWWRDYRVSASLELGAGKGSTGLAACLKGTDGYFLTLTHPGKVALLQVTGSESTQLASANYPTRAGVWYRLALEVAHGMLTGHVDGNAVVSARDASHARGKAGLMLSGNMRVSVDDVAVESVGVALDFDGENPVAGCERVSGDWLIAESEGGDRSLSFLPGSEQGLVLIGSPEWRNLTMSASIDVPKGSATPGTNAGLVFCAEDRDNYYALTRNSHGNWSFVRTADGRSRTFMYPGHPIPKPAGEVTLRIDEGVIAVFLDGTRAFNLTDTKLKSGRVGLIASGEGPAHFDNFRVRASSARLSRREVNPVFKAQGDMKNWSSESTAWRRADGGTRWHSGTFNRDVAVTVQTLPKSTAVSLEMSPSAIVSDGYRLALTPTAGDGPSHYTLHLKRRGNIVATASCNLSDNSLITLAKRDGLLAASVDDGVLIAWHDDSPISIHKVGFTGQVRYAGAEAPDYFDYTFHTAPVDWEPTSGEWGVTQRWACDPRWSFFGGRSRKVAAIWSKKKFKGDITVELWCAPGTHVQDYKRYREHWLEGAYQYDHPSDLNVTICGDGRNPESGYAFVFNGWDRTATKILRRGKPVAETTEYLFATKDRYDRKYNHHWFHIVITRKSGSIYYSVDGRSLLRFEDSDPIPGGRIAFWTKNNRLLIGRVRIYADVDAARTTTH